MQEQYEKYVFPTYFVMCMLFLSKVIKKNTSLPPFFGRLSHEKRSLPHFYLSGLLKEWLVWQRRTRPNALSFTIFSFFLLRSMAKALFFHVWLMINMKATNTTNALSFTIFSFFLLRSMAKALFFHVEDISFAGYFLARWLLFQRYVKSFFKKKPHTWRVKYSVLSQWHIFIYFCLSFSFFQITT